MFGQHAKSTQPPAGGTPPVDQSPYARHKARTAARQRKISAESREISADLPEVKDPARKKRALAQLKVFCRTYFPDVFYLPFSRDHERVIAKAERAAREGGQFALAMPRGSGKSRICVTLCLWSIFNGYHRVVMLIAASRAAAAEMLAGIVEHLTTNELLMEDFPEVCYPLRRMEGINQRRLLFRGELIAQKCLKDVVHFPSLPPSPASSACIVARGITGRVRGFSVTRPGGREDRPTLAICDDPQTDKSAKSLNQTNTREAIINGAVLGLGPPDKPIAVLIPCTVILPDDLADRLLDHERNGQWAGERTKFIYEWPKGADSEKLWEEYSVLWKRATAAGQPTTAATALFRKHRKVMEAGAVVAWPERKYKGTISAVQHAFNLVLKMGKPAFEAEYNNNPARTNLEEAKWLKADEVAARVNRLERGVVPALASHLTAMIDVQGDVLFYVVVAWAQDFTGWVVDYGSYPDQGRLYWTKSDLERTYLQLLPHAPFEAQLHAALEGLTTQLLGREWPREGGSGFAHIDRCLIDTGWGDSTDLIFAFCRQSKFRSVLMPSKGFGIKATDTPFIMRKVKPGEIATHPGWRVPLAPSHRVVKAVHIDTNWAKSFVEHRLRTPIGARGALTLFGDSAGLHRMFGDHVTSEPHFLVEARGRKVVEWKDPLPGRDNDWWDCLVGCAVAAEMLGADLLSEIRPPKRSTRSTIPEHMIAGRAL